ncbi:dihydrofolate reductase family protein [Gordonia sp. CPCC 205333]|uniref:dihydrofolate reductase family protein n=1 Tax=Gordonia sp. CPCC 205333 TaxID=3140790 RepID=UPI003AF40803
MTATYTADVFMTLDGYGSTHTWGGNWGKGQADLWALREQLYTPEQLIVLGANTYRVMAKFGPGLDVAWIKRFCAMDKVVYSNGLTAPLSLNSTLSQRDAVDSVRELKQTSSIPLRSHGSLTLNRALLAAGLVDRLEVTIFPVLTPKTGVAPVFGGATSDFDLELIESHTLDDGVVWAAYRPTPYDPTAH